MRTLRSTALIAMIVAVLNIDSGIARESNECPAQLFPPNIDMPADLKSRLVRVYGQSSTFRTQCERISAATNVWVSVRVELIMNSSCRAFTVFRKRKPSGLVAIVHLPPTGNMLAELIGHEFEHIIEQIDGLDLPALAQVRDSGVFRLENNLFETDRARRVGREIDEQVRGRAERPSPAAAHRSE